MAASNNVKRFLPAMLGGRSDNVWNRKLAPLHDQFSKFVFNPLHPLIRKIKPSPRMILEIGVARGIGAKSIIGAAKKAGSAEVEYYGFDLFEILEIERVKKTLEKTGAKVHLFKGDSRETLPRELKNLPKMDFVYIDGGHSYNVAKSDWENVRKLMHNRTIVAFHDYKREKGVTRTVNEIDKKIYNIEVILIHHIQFLPFP